MAVFSDDDEMVLGRMLLTEVSRCGLIPRPDLLKSLQSPVGMLCLKAMVEVGGLGVRDPNAPQIDPNEDLELHARQMVHFPSLEIDVALLRCGRDDTPLGIDLMEFGVGYRDMFGGLHRSTTGLESLRVKRCVISDPSLLFMDARTSSDDHRITEWCRARRIRRATAVEFILFMIHHRGAFKREAAYDSGEYEALGGEKRQIVAHLTKQRNNEFRLRFDTLLFSVPYNRGHCLMVNADDPENSPDRDEG